MVMPVAQVESVEPRDTCVAVPGLEKVQTDDIPTTFYWSVGTEPQLQLAQTLRRYSIL